MIFLLVILLFFLIIIAILIYKRHKKIAISLFSIPIFLVLLLFGWGFIEANYRFVKSTDLSQEFLGDIYLNHSLADYKKLNSAIEFSKRENVYYPIYLESSSLAIGANENDEILFVQSSLTEHETSKKIKVTDNEKLIIQKYGANYYKDRDMGMGEYIVYVDRDSKRYIRFWLESGKVIAIEFEKI